MEETKGLSGRVRGAFGWLVKMECQDIRSSITRFVHIVAGDEFGLLRAAAVAASTNAPSPISSLDVADLSGFQNVHDELMRDHGFRDRASLLRSPG